MYDYNYPRTLERTGQWAEAAKVWKMMGQSEDAEACHTIANSIQTGDNKRAKDKETVYSIFQTPKGNFMYSTDAECAQDFKLLGSVLGIGEATYYVSVLQSYKERLEEFVKEMKKNFPSLNQKEL